jgi:hypothetical protein
VPGIIHPVFAKTSQNARFLLSENERFGLVFVKTRVYKFGHWSENDDPLKDDIRTQLFYPVKNKEKEFINVINNFKEICSAKLKTHC